MFEQEFKAFREAALPLMQWLADNRHPHVTVIVDSERAELLEGQAVAVREERNIVTAKKANCPPTCRGVSADVGQMGGGRMTNEQINQAIAEACGWNPEKNYWLTPEGCEAFTWDIPDYCNDLNAMHKAEKAMVAIQWYQYALHLNEVCWHWALIHAAPRQRAEAFLRTINKWEEVQG